VYKRQIYQIAESNRIETFFARIGMLYPAPLARWTRAVSAPDRRGQYDPAGRGLFRARRCSDVTRCNGIGVPSYCPIFANVTSFIKPEVHNLSQRRQRRTEPRPYVTCIKKFGNDETCSSGDKLADRHTQTDKHTHTHTHYFPTTT